MAMTSNRLPAPINGRQGPVVTQTITRPFTTITAVVTLGDDPATSSTSNPTTPTTSTTTSAGPISPAPPSAITPEQLGAILGSILGFALLALLICCCLSARRRRRQQTTTRISSYTDYYDDDSSVSEREVVVETTLRSTPAWNRPPLRPWPVAPPTTTGAAGAAAGGSGGGGGWTTVPPPVRFPPTPRYTPYRQTRHPQMPGVMRRP